ncbi:MAG: outer membrane protein assembly factor BamB [Gammaproteobacteria bacterium]|nr:outer membrane protein assembly factor BamB [Gammaproteobacteria bacterium]
MRALLIFTSLLLVACASQRAEKVVLAPLPAIDNTITIKKIWQKNTNNGEADLYLGLTAVSDSVDVFVASHKGIVQAYALEDGDALWRKDTSLALSMGPQVGTNLLIVGAVDGVVIALDKKTGERRWQADVAGEMLALPVIGDDVVVMRTIDGRLIALAANSGKQQWQLKVDTPDLSGRGTSAPIINENLVVAGFDDGRLIALDATNGRQVWQQQIGVAQGKNDIERLTDIDSTPVWVENIIYASALNQRVVSIQASSGRPLWSQNVYSREPLTADWTRIYLTTPDDDVTALRQSNGLTAWTQTALDNRQLSGPAVYGNWVLVGDVEGYLHVLTADNGHFVGRTRVASAPLRKPVQIIGEYVLAYAENGTVAVYSLTSSK